MERGDSEESSVLNTGYQLKIVDGLNCGQVFVLTRNEIGLGRGQMAASTPGELFFQEATVSRVHAKLVWHVTDQSYDLVHLSQTNQTVVNHHVVQQHRLQVGDLIQLGMLVLEFQQIAKLEVATLAEPLNVDVLPEPGAMLSGQGLPAGTYLAESIPNNLVGKRLGPYRLGKELGRGAVGRVYIAEHMTRGDTCAIKILSPEATRDATFLKRFKNEARLASSLQHPNITRVTDINHSDGLVYLVMDYGGPHNLQSVLEKHKRPLPTPRVVRILDQLLAAVEYAHQHHVVHRDLKPANILVNDPNDHLSLTDFSIAQVKDGIRLTSVGVILGTVEYMAPELFEGESAGFPADLYAVGVILYEMLTGVLPFQGRTNAEVIRAQLLQFPPNPQTINPTAPDALVQLAFIALQKEPDKRFSSATAMREAFLSHMR